MTQELSNERVAGERLNIDPSLEAYIKDPIIYARWLNIESVTELYQGARSGRWVARPSRYGSPMIVKWVGSSWEVAITQINYRESAFLPFWLPLPDVPKLP